MPWNIMLLLGGGFAMAKGCEVRVAGGLQTPGRVGRSQSRLQAQHQSERVRGPRRRHCVLRLALSELPSQCLVLRRKRGLGVAWTLKEFKVNITLMPLLLAPWLEDSVTAEEHHHAVLLLCRAQSDGLYTY